MTSRTFSPTGRGERVPNSNTGLKCLSAPIIDALTVVIPSSFDAQVTSRVVCDFLSMIFQWSVVVGQIQARMWNFCPRHAVLLGVSGDLVGKVGFRDDGALLVSVMGTGCAAVPDFSHVADVLESLSAYITRVDIAIDDLGHGVFDVHEFRAASGRGEFVTNGRPPDARFISDEGSGKGCTLYIGSKGHKELCIYDKGKQLGDPESKHVRVELRLYSKQYTLDLDVLRNPGSFFAAGYPMLAQFVVGEVSKLVVKKAVVSASAVAMVRVLRTQAGTALGLLSRVFGDEFVSFLASDVLRQGRPARFRGFSDFELPDLLASQLCVSRNGLGLEF